MDQVKTVLVGTKTLMREGLKGLLANTSIQIIAEAQNLSELEPILAAKEVDLVLFDVGDFSSALADNIRDLKRRHTSLRLVLLSDQLDGPQLAASLSAGVDGYLMKEISYSALLQSLRLVMVGEKVFPTELATLLVNGTPSAPVSGKRHMTEEVRDRGLSDREMQILQCLAQGDSNKLIANRLEITEATVKVHVKSLLRKIQASNRTQAAIWAVNQGLA